MQKIPTLFERNFGPDVDSPATDTVRDGCEWVLEGHGTAFKKFDGQAVAVFGGDFYKRRTLRNTNQNDADTKTLIPSENGAKCTFYDTPEGWAPAQRYPRANGKWPGWTPVDRDDPQNQHIVEALKNTDEVHDGTFEAVGPKIQGNPHGFDRKHLIRHMGSEAVLDVDVRNYKDVYNVLVEIDVEGIVWHRADGQRAKIKRTDFGLQWPIE